MTDAQTDRLFQGRPPEDGDKFRLDDTIEPPEYSLRQLISQRDVDIANRVLSMMRHYTAFAAKQHLDTTKPDDGGAAAAWPDNGDPSESLMGCNGARYSTLRVGQNTMRIFGPGVNIDYRASGPDHELLIYVAERAFDATTTPSPNEDDDSTVTVTQEQIVEIIERGGRAFNHRENPLVVGGYVFSELQRTATTVAPNDREAEIRADERRRIDEILRELHRRWDEVHIRFGNFGGDDELCEVRLFEWPDAEQEGDGSWSAASPGSSKEHRAATLPEALEAATQSIQAEAGGPENG